jgi:hypothetical protein
MNEKSNKRESEDISEYLEQFCQNLDDIVTGKKACRLQLRDIGLFKTIKHKIDSYPVLNELYAKIHQSKSAMPRPRTASKMKSHASFRPLSGMTGRYTTPEFDSNNGKRNSFNGNLNGSVNMKL